MESALYGIYALVRNLTRSLRSLVQFLIRQQLVRKYRTPALSMKYSLYTGWARKVKLILEEAENETMNFIKRRSLKRIQFIVLNQ